MITFIDKY